MPGTRTSISKLAAAAVAAIGLWAQPGSLPLEVGNQWVYRMNGPGGASAVTAEIAGSQVVNGKAYSLLRGLPGAAREILLREDTDGRLWQLDTETKQERIWLDLAVAEGETVPTGVDPCTKASRVESRQAKYTGPLGDFTWAIYVRYEPGPCADAGMVSDYLLPSVGFVRRSMQSIVGPRQWDLVYARLGSATMVSEPEVALSLALDRAVYWANMMPPIDPQRAVPVLAARLTFRNTTGTPIELTFRTPLLFDLLIRNEKGLEVYRWSAGQNVIQVLQTEKFSGERNWAVTVPLRATAAGGVINLAPPLPEGRYTVEAWLNTVVEKQFAATASFEIKYAQ